MQLRILHLHKMRFRIEHWNGSADGFQHLCARSALPLCHLEPNTTLSDIFRRYIFTSSKINNVLSAHLLCTEYT